MSNPTTCVESFAGSLGAFSGVPPIRYGDGLWVEESTTNLEPNPVVLLDTFGWDRWGSTAVTRVDTTATIGDWCLQLTRPTTESSQKGVANNNNGRKPVTAGLVYIAGMSVVSSVAINNMSIGIRWLDASNNLLSTTLLNNQAVGTDPAHPTRLTLSGTAPVNATQAEVIAYTASGTSGDYQQFTRFQFEEKGYPTSLAVGNMGSGYAFTGTVHRSSSTRAASSASIATAGHLDPSSGAIAMRIQPTIETGVEELWGEAGVKGAATDHVRWGRDATKHPFVEWSSNDAAYQRLTASETIDAGTEKFLYFGHAGTTTSLQVDSGTLQTGSRAAVSASFGAGPLTLRASAGGNIVSPFATFDQPLDAGYRGMVRDEMAAGGANLWNLLNADGSLSGSMELSHPLSARFALDALLPGTLDLS